MKIFLEAVGEHGATKLVEASTDHLLWVRLELASGHIVTVQEEAQREEGVARLLITTPTGRFRINLDCSNNLILDAISLDAYYA